MERFQQEEGGPQLFMLSLKAGGTGLNLTRANHVFHFDRRLITTGREISQTQVFGECQVRYWLALNVRQHIIQRPCRRLTILHQTHRHSHQRFARLSTIRGVVNGEKHYEIVTHAKLPAR